MSILKKLQSKRGESLAEVLVALLVSTAGIMMLAGMITSATNMISKSRNAMNDYYERNNYLETHTNGSGISVGSGTVFLKDSAGDTGDGNKIADVSYYINEQGNERAIAYAKDTTEADPDPDLGGE